MPGTSGTSERNTTAYDLPGFLGSARENGGYYIGRYEASYASGVTSGTTVDYGNCKAASKKSKEYSETSMDYTPGTLWNYITQLDASTVAMTTYFSGQITGGIKSDLMNSYAWDTAIMYIHEAANSNYAYQEGTELNTSLTDTGANDDEVCKINDMASNISEWTTETSDDNRNYWSGPCTYRGGNYEASWTAFRNCYKPTNANANIGFRIVLYL